MKRGEIWLARHSSLDMWHSTQERPVLIVSSDRGNENERMTNVLVAACTSSVNKSFFPLNIKVTARELRGDTWAMCNNIFRVEKDTLTRCLGSVTEEQMADVDRALCDALALPRITAVTVEPQRVNDELRVERDLYKRLYETAIEKFAARRFVRDEVK